MAEHPVQLRKHVTHTNRTKIIVDAIRKARRNQKMEAHSLQTVLNYKSRNKTEIKVADQNMQISTSFLSKKLKSWFCQPVKDLCTEQTCRPGLS